MRSTRNRQAADKVVYPPKCREITEDLSTDDLIRRLKDISMAFQDFSQEEDNSQFIPLALLLSNDFYLEHSSRDVRLLVACSIADVFRVYAPNAPYENEELIKKIFRFFIQQLKGLQDPKHPTFKRYFYLLENLAWVKSFNICIELEDSQTIFCELFSLIFSIVNENHSDKVKNFMADMLSPLISESDNTSPELLEILLIHLIEPKKTQAKHACSLSQEIIRRTVKTLGYFIVKYLDTAIASETANPVTEDLESDNGTTNGQTASYFRKNISGICDLIYELNKVCSTVLQDFLPQLEYKIKSNDEKERCEFTKLLARLFSDKESNLSELYPELWKSFLGRFKDISATVRIKCVQYSMHFLINHPEMKPDVTAQLKHRFLDPDDNVRHEVVMAIASTAKKGMDYINEELIEIIVNRTQDAKFKIRRESLYALAQLYKQYVLQLKPEGILPTSDEGLNATKMLHCIKNKCLENYYRPSLEDKLVVERILSAFLVPVSLPLEERMRVLYIFFATINDVAAKAFSAIQRQQQIVRHQVLEILEVLKEPSGAAKDAALKQKVQICAKSLLEPVKTEEFIMKFIENLKKNPSLLEHFELVICATTRSPYDDDGNFRAPPSSKQVDQSAREVLRSLGYPVQTNSFYVIIKNLMERVAPIMIDHDGLLILFQYVSDSLIGDGELDSKMGITNSSKRGLELILSFANVFPNLFHGKEPYNSYLLPFLWLEHSNHHVAEVVLQILAAIGNHPFSNSNQVNAKKSDAWWSQSSDVIPRIINSCILNASSPKQAKFAIQCINSIISDETEKEKIYGQILDSIKEAGLTLESSNFRAHLAALGMIATCGGQNKYPAVLKSIIHKFVVQGLIMKDTRSDIEIKAQERSEASLKEEDRICPDRCSEEVKCKIEGLKLLVRWIHGMKLNWLYMQDKEDLQAKYVKTATNALQLCKTIIQNAGDLNEKDAAGTTTEKAHLRLSAALAMLKIVGNDSIALSKSIKNSLGGDSSDDKNENLTVVKTPAAVSSLLTPQQLHILATTLIDKEDFVKKKFAAKLHRKLFGLELGLEFLAILSLGGTFMVDSKPDSYYAKLKSYLDMNLNKRREFIKTNSAYMNALYPDCTMPFVIHLLAHMPFYTKYDDTNQLDTVKDCLWFIMEPLVFKNDSYSFTFFKKTFESIKICIDKVSAPEDDGALSPAATLINYKIYCACDLALGLVMSKTQNFALKESPVKPQLHSRYYTRCKTFAENNHKCYLPESMQFPPPKRCGLETEILGKLNKKVKRS